MVAAPRALDRARPIWRAVATSVVPEAAQLDAAEWAGLEAIVARALAARPARTQRQVALFLTLLDWLPVLRYGRRLRALDARRRERFLSFLQHAPSLLVRHGFWGVRTLVLLGYYGRPGAEAGSGYQAEPRGWEARGGGQRGDQPG
jgi:hypothetical protein